MKINGLQEQDSLAREALRQAIYYRTRNARLHRLWDTIHKEAMLAMTTERALIIAPEDRTPIPIIKACEQSEELHNPLED